MRVAAAFVPNYSVSLGGVEVSARFRRIRSLAVSSTTGAAGDPCLRVGHHLRNRRAEARGRLSGNGARCLRRTSAVIVLTGSREALVASVLVGLALLRVRRGIGLPALIVVAVAATALSAPFAGSGPNTPNLASRGLVLARCRRYSTLPWIRPPRSPQTSASR